jgi:hypothetical protein
MAVHHRLLTLHEALGRCSSRPANRKVVMVARVTPAFDIANLELPALDRGAGILGGRVRPIPDGLEIVTWNTGEASDLRKYGNRSHAEAQFFGFMADHEFTSVEIEISHSPCTACSDMLVGLLKSMRAKGRTVSTHRVGQRTYVGYRDAAIPAALRWGELYDMPPQATTPQCLRELQAAGWQMAAPRAAIPNDAGTPPIILL